MDARGLGHIPWAAMGRLAGFLAVLLCLLAALSVRAQVSPAPASSTTANNITATLVSEGPAIPGEPLILALLFDPAPGWHGYWSNPGDAGYGMELDWTLPPGWRAGEPLYPVPERLVIAGMMNHIYKGPYAVLVPIAVPIGATTEGDAAITLDARWLACTDKICVPEAAALSLRIPSERGAAARDPRFDAWRAAIPPLIDRRAVFEQSPATIRIAIALPASLDLGELHIFIGDQGVIDHPGEQSFRRLGDILVAELPRHTSGDVPRTLTGVLAFGDGARNGAGGLRFVAEPGTVPQGGEALRVPAAADAPLVLLAGGALLGGLLLNLMPCVFPILSLKALTLARAGAGQVHARHEAIAYTGGVVLACLALGAALLLLRAAGNEVGWAFQLQEPGVVLVLLAIAVAITANLAGLYELPALSLTRANGGGGAFATGVLAAFVATPCTGPFMAAALGAALLLPWEQALLLFGVLGLGLALPFLLLGFVPPLRRMLPRPGAWMERFRKAMAIPMGLTALALAWLAWRLGGVWLAIAGLAAAAVLVAALRGLGRRREQGRPMMGGVVAASLALLLALAIALPQSSDTPSGTGTKSLLDPLEFDRAVLTDTLQAQDRPVFLWFTADWCLTCKVNESVAIEREAVRAAFAEAEIITMRGDWTRADPAIARFLAEHGAAGVPLYLWYPGGGAAPEQLPQVLSADMLIERARKAGPVPARS